MTKKLAAKPSPPAISAAIAKSAGSRRRNSSRPTTAAITA